MSIALENERFERIYDENYRTVYRYFYYKTGNRQSAEDLASETFIKALKYFARYDESRSSAGTWLLILGRSVFVDYCRGRGNRVYEPEEVMSELEFSETPEVRLIEYETYAALYSAIGELSEKERNLIALKYSSGLKNREIAAVIGKSERHTAVLLCRALTKLKKILTEKGVDLNEQ